MDDENDIARRVATATEWRSDHHESGPEMMMATLVQVGAAGLGLAAVSLLVLESSTAAFSATTATQGTWTAAQVSLSDDDGAGQVAFSSPTAMVPGDSDQACITVTYTGDVNAEVRLYGATSAPSGLEQYLDLVIEEVTIGAGSCTTPATVDRTVYPATGVATAGSFVAAHTAWADAAATSWTAASPAAPNAAKVFRITVTLQDDNAAQAKTTTTTFTWESQNV